MSDLNEPTLHILQEGFRTIHENSDRMLVLNETIVEKLNVDRVESDRRFNKQARKLRVQQWALAFVVVLGVWSNIQQALEAVRREERAQVAEAQRKCVTIVQNAALARLSILATATPSRVNGAPAVDPAALSRLREDVALSNTLTTPDPVLLARIRDQVAVILAALPAASIEAQRLRDDVAQANRALLEVDRRCFTGTPSDNPLAN